MSEIEPKKLKVAELREELKARGLESKGNKAQLVKRLEKHLANESGVSEADVSVEGDAEEAQEEQPAGGAAVPEPVQTEEPVVAEHELEPEAEPEQVEPKTEPEPVQQEPEPVKVEDQSELVKDEPNSEEAAQHEPMEDEPVAAEIKSDEQETVKKEPVDNGVAEEVKAEENEGEGGEDVDLSQEEFQVMDQVGGDDDDKKDDDRRDKRHHSSDRKRSRSPRDRDRHYKRRSRTPPPVVMDSDDWLESTEVELDRFNSDLNLRIEENGTKANPITVEGFAFMWGGARSSYGVTKGKVGFEVKVLEHLNVRHLPPEETSRHVLRVGFSTDATSLQLGEEPLSYGYGGTAKASTDCKFKDYGEKFGEGDVVGAYLDLDADPVTISYTKNGEDQGVCYEIERATLGDNALFPHVLTKNSEFEVNFGKKEEPFFPTKEEYTLIAQIPLEDRVRGTLPPAKKEDCEMIMMCGLPGAGKTYWAAKYAAENPEKRYFTLGTNNIIDKMKVMGLPRKKNYAGRWDVLIDKSSFALTRLFEIAAKKKRNYILDQTNVYPNAQRRKMRPFEGFQRKAVVIVPTDEEFKNRIEKREKVEGKDVPDHAVLEMKANFVLPEEGMSFDKVEYVELDKEEAKKLVEQYNKEGKAACPPDAKRYRYGDRDRHSGGDRYGINVVGGGRGRDWRGGDRRGGYRDGGYRGSRGRDGGDRYGSRGGYDRHKNSGSYMGYSDRDRQRYSKNDDHRSSDRSTSRYDRNRSSSSSSYGDKSYGQSSGSWGNQGGWNQGQWGSGQQSGWGQQGQWGSGQQSGWGQQQSWGQYNQNQSGQQSWGNQGYNYGNYNYNQSGYSYPQSSSSNYSQWYGYQSK